MLSKIREKSKGAFSWILLLVIGIPFTLWGIENYIRGASEKPLASVGNKDFFQNDLNRAYQQYSQNFAGMNIDEETVKKYALDKLVKDEVLLQHAESQHLAISDQTAKTLIKSLDYFKVNGQFDTKQYQALLNSQHLSSAEFVNRIKKSQLMEQYQRTITEGNFATHYDIEYFFKIQNQLRDIDYVTLSVKSSNQTPTESQIQNYYQAHQSQYQTTEQVAIEYITLSLDELARDVKVNNEQLKAFYEEQKSQYTVAERRKISHILFAFGKGETEAQLLKKAEQTLVELKQKSFETLATELSDDKASAAKGGDLGLFESGIMDKAFETAASQLKLNEISQPIKSAYGYHLIKVTELIPAQIKSFDTVKTQITKAYQRKEAETRFYALNDKIAEVSYQNPDSLLPVADAIGVSIQKTALFSREQGKGIAGEATVRNAAFSEEVLKGNNSEPIEVENDKIIVLRMTEHHPAAPLSLTAVKSEIIKSLQIESAKQQVIQLATELKKQLMSGQTLHSMANKHQLAVKTITKLERESQQLPPSVIQAIFKAAKPTSKPSILTVAMPNGEQMIISLNKVTEGIMSESDKKQLSLAQQNIARALGRSNFDAILTALQAAADVEISLPVKSVQN